MLLIRVYHFDILYYYYYKIHYNILKNLCCSSLTILQSRIYFFS